MWNRLPFPDVSRSKSETQIHEGGCQTQTAADFRPSFLRIGTSTVVIHVTVAGCPYRALPTTRYARTIWDTRSFRCCGTALVAQVSHALAPHERVAPERISGLNACRPECTGGNAAMPDADVRIRRSAVDGVRKERRGFASMSPEKQREIASKGGRAAHEKGTAHEWTADEARAAGRKGGQISRGGRGRLVTPAPGEAASSSASDAGAE